MSATPKPPANKRRPSAPPPPLPPAEGDGADGSLPATEVDALDPSARHAAVGARASDTPPRSRAAALLARARGALSVASAVAVLAASVVGGRLAHRWVTHTPRFGARVIDVVGARHATRDEVLAAAGIAPGINVLGLDTARAERGVRELPWVEDATVARRLPGYVRIEVDERTPVALVSAGAQYLCAADGTVFKRLRPGDPDDLPLVTGISREDFARDPDAARENVRDALALLSDLASSSLAGRVHADEVHRDATGDLSLSLVENGTYVWLGRGPYRAKLARLSAILAELDRQHLRAAEIHLESDRHPERATVRVPVAALDEAGQ